MNIFLSQLPLSITQEEINEIFSPFGTPVSIRIMQDKHTGLPDGTAYVVMASQEEADQAITKLNGALYKGSTLQVRHADSAEFPTGDFW